LKREKLIKESKRTRKLKHADSILEYFEYFCQMSSKSIIIILSYTVSKLVHFLRHSVECIHIHTSTSRLVPVPVIRSNELARASGAFVATRISTNACH